MTDFAACPELRHRAGTIRLRSHGSFDSGALRLYGDRVQRLVQPLFVTTDNDPFLNVPLLPRYIDKLVFHVSFDSSTYLARAARMIPFESYARRRVVFILSDRAKVDSVPAAPPYFLSPYCSLLTSLATGILWYAIHGARVTVVGLESVNPGWMGVDLLCPAGHVNPRAIRKWLKQVGINEPRAPDSRALVWANINFVSHEEYRISLGDEEYAMETEE